QLAQVREHIGTFTSTLQQQHSKFLTDMQHFYDAASMERVFSNLGNTMEKVSKTNQEAIGQQFRSGLGNVSTYFGQVQTGLQLLERSISRTFIWTIRILAATAVVAVLIWF